jgi:hypothetical protein
MAEIRINATGGVKLYDADDSHYAQIIAGTITSNVDALTLGHASADFNIPVKVLGTTPTLTIGDAGAEDTKIVFDGNAQDYYIALDDSADDLLIGKGSTVGTTPAIAIDSDLKVNIPVTTASTSASTGSLTTGGGAGIGADLYVGDDAYLITDSAVLGFGADKDTTLTHTDGTGLTLNSTNKLCFNDASQFVQGISATVLGLGATDEIDLTATAIDINGTCDISGTFSLGGTNMTATAAELNLLDGGTSVGSSITLADADGIIVNDGGTMKTIPASDISTFAGGGAWVVLQKQTASSDSTLTFSSTYITDTYPVYKIICNAIRLGTDESVCEWDLSVDNGSNYLTDYDQFQSQYHSNNGETTQTNKARYALDTGGSTQGVDKPMTFLGGLGNSMGNSTGEGAVAEVTFWNLRDTTMYKIVGFWSAMYMENVFLGDNHGFGGTRTTTAINNIRIKPNTGNIATGTFTLYGLKDS